MNAQRSGLEWWPTEQILIVYERLFGRLDPKAKQRILAAASTHGWNRTFEHAAYERAA